MSWENAADQFTRALALPEPTPGGGAAAAMAGAMGCALAQMAVATTLKRAQTPVEFRASLEKSHHKLAGLHHTLKDLMQQDAQAYDAYIAACKLPKENSSRLQVMQDALWFAATVPADTAATCREVLQEVEQVQDKIAPVILSDVACARHLLRGAIACCTENIRANLVYIKQPERVKKIMTLLETYESNRN